MFGKLAFQAFQAFQAQGQANIYMTDRDGCWLLGRADGRTARWDKARAEGST